MIQKRTIPNFFIVGAQKCGTTALSQYLGEHQRIFVPKFKEPHYFASDFDSYRPIKTYEEYRKLFAPCTDQHLMAGEASVLYIYSKVAIKNIKEFNNKAKIIVMVRNPIDLVYSLHSQLLYAFHETEKEFRKAWDLQEQRRSGKEIPETCRLPALLQYRDEAFLGEQAERLLEYFPNEQVKFIIFDEFKRDPGGVYREVLEFLEVPDDNRQDFPIINENKAHRSYWMAGILQKRNNKPAAWLVKLDRLCSKIPGGKNIHLKDTLLNLNLNKRKRPPLDPDFRSQLAEVFREDVEKLSRIVNRDLSHWTQPARLQSPALAS